MNGVETDFPEHCSKVGKALTFNKVPALNGNFRKC